MAQPPLMYKDNRDEWGTTKRRGYEDLGPFREQPPTPRKEPGSPVLRTIGSICIVGGICWGTYLVTRGGDVVSTLQQNHGPIAIIGLGVLASIVGKYLRV
jgi:hypothetical protein